jgi:predicted SnoaL-like aldol condensation-catalyzing enzyme
METANKALVSRLFLDGFSKNDAEVLREVLHEDFQLSSAGAIAGDNAKRVSGVEVLVQGMHHNHRCFENWSFELHHILAEDDHVAVHWTATGKHVGSFMGETPTQRDVALQGNSLFRLKDGKIVKDWVFSNKADFGAELGIGAPPAKGKGAALVRAFWDQVINAHDPDAADTLMAPDYRQHAAGIAQGPVGFKAFLRDVLANSTGMRATVLGVIEAEALVISTTQITFERPPEGWDAKQVIVDVFRTNGQQLLEHWDMPAGRAAS